ncbi:glycosyltransferase family 2 protein [Foetidibacter luteolus]|uniref:glycosyltransferase family 2 protein n=1 Tax=Foetidibacter luteolus TaxID=2608880 RepID=UPI00129AB90A|nr:glycosyltransferase family 2 protein [Foetidibacter luteolus]
MKESRLDNHESEIVISIIIATFNAAPYLRECLESIAAQQFKQMEVVIVDGGSTDGTVDIIKNFKKIALTWVSGPDKGIYDAFNKGLKMARGEWIHFLGADDKLLPSFSQMAQNLKDSDTVYYGNSVPFISEGKKPSYDILSGPFSKYRLAKYCINHQAILYPARVFKEYGYSLKYRVFGDYDLNIKVWGNSSFTKRYYPIDMVLYNMAGFSSTNNDVLFKQDKPKLIKESLGLFIYWRYSYKKLRNRLKGEDNFF